MESEGSCKDRCRQCCRRPQTKKEWGCCIFSCLCVVSILVVLVTLIGYVAFLGGSGIITLQADARADCDNATNPTNAMRTTWLPGCGSAKEARTNAELDSCGAPCFSSASITAMETYFATVGFLEIKYTAPKHPEGQSAVTIKGWYIPPAAGINVDAGKAPRVVFSHGTNQNQNKFEALQFAFIMSSAGFGVLLPSLRDHGYSGASDHGKFSWGWDYPFDILGAITYARADPDGVMGGALSPDLVGLAGFSLGGFNAMTAFGLDGEIPGVWVEGPVYSVKKVLRDEMRKQVSFLADLSLEWAWRKANEEVELHYNHPDEALRKGPDRSRKVYLVANTEDPTVPLHHLEDYKELIKEFPKKYTLSGTWFGTGDCNKDKHRIFAMLHPEEYRRKACLFFTDVFSLDIARCTRNDLAALKSNS